ncbi:50S ribosomal protein L24 [Tessaracoccus sp. HDW20]|uniref:50S ribosomal protein L24 n=1 Tax=Tessaracoccus coleopterorum TaxID=2714950 RepID=UPI001E64158B|nr:50S ribosomal protein L24 [Tessaracoccus coleopterorum]NHB84090.1 50S ribosomal protein L24 [Tessaracoccus coleopterorum]
MAGLNIKKGDRVLVISGNDKGAKGEVIAVDIEGQRVTVQGVNLVKKHRRESQTANGRRVEGGIINVEAPVHVSNVQLLVQVDGKDVPTRIGFKRVEVEKRRADGSTYKGQRSVRIARKTGEEI